MKVSLNDQNGEKTDLELNPDVMTGREPVTIQEFAGGKPDELKKLKKKANADFSLHVLLIMRQDGETIATARFIAWLEGYQGLSRRLAG